MTLVMHPLKHHAVQPAARRRATLSGCGIGGCHKLHAPPPGRAARPPLRPRRRCPGPCAAGFRHPPRPRCRVRSVAGKACGRSCAGCGLWKERQSAHRRVAHQSQTVHGQTRSSRPVIQSSSRPLVQMVNAHVRHDAKPVQPSQRGRPFVHCGNEFTLGDQRTCGTVADSEEAQRRDRHVRVQRVGVRTEFPRLHNTLVDRLHRVNGRQFSFWMAVLCARYWPLCMFLFITKRTNSGLTSWQSKVLPPSCAGRPLSVDQPASGRIQTGECGGRRLPEWPDKPSLLVKPS